MLGLLFLFLLDFVGDWKGGLHNIEMFNIRGNTIGDVGAKALAQAFQLHHAIRVSVHVVGTFVRSRTDQNMNIHAWTICKVVVLHAFFCICLCCVLLTLPLITTSFFSMLAGGECQF